MLLMAKFVLSFALLLLAAVHTLADDRPLIGPPAPPRGEESLEPFEPPELHQGVADLLEQPYFTADELASLRVEHGVWTDEDLQHPARAARAALLVGAYLHPALQHEQAAPLDRAEAFVRAGKPEEALSLIDRTIPTLAYEKSSLQTPVFRAARLKCESLLDLGKAAEATALLDGCAAYLKQGTVAEAGEIAEAARCMVLLARQRGAEGNNAVGYQTILSLLATGREVADRLSWRVYLAEALLLHEKDNYEECGAALETALSLNPRCAEGWQLLGTIFTDSFDFPKARSVALRLEAHLKGSASPLPSLLRAGVCVREIEGAEALAHLKPALDDFPASREVLAAQAAARAVSFDFDAVDAAIKAFDTLSPNAPDAAMAAGKALASARQYDESARFLRAAADRAPGWAKPRIELGLSELQAGKLSQADRALREGLALDRFNLRASNSTKLLEELATYATIESQHFIVRCKPGVDEVVAREMIEPLERIHARVTGDKPGGIRHVPKEKTVVELYPDHRWFSTRIVGMPQLHTIAAATGPVIAMEAPRSGPKHKVGAYDWARVVQHEFTHTVTLSRTRNRLPHWFTEASAVYLEDAPKDFNVVRLLHGAYANDALFDFDTISLMFIRPQKTTDRGQAYAQGAWMYEFMIERFGPEAPLQLMDLYASGTREPQAFQQILGVSRESFFDQFHAWAGQQLITWGMAPSDKHPSLAAIQEKLGLTLSPTPTPEAVATMLGKYPENPFVLAEAFQQATEGEATFVSAETVALAERYAAARPVDPAPHKLLARHHLAGNDPARAIPHLEYLDAREQNSTAYATELARRYAALGKWEEAIRKATRATQISPYDAGAREFAATIALRAKRPREAERHIHALTVLEPDRPEHKQRLDAVRRMQ
jgi:tetratricopeptide (TPR) repeat protein